METYKKYFKKNEETLKKLERLHQNKYELLDQLKQSKKLGIDLDPYIIELSGLPRTGKSVTIDKLNEFFKMADFKVARTTEPAEILKNSCTLSEISKLSNVEFNDRTLEISRNELKRLKSQKPDIILQDRGVIDNYFWYQMMFNEKTITPEYYETKLLEMAYDLIDLDQLFVLTAIPDIIVFRDYMNQIFLEPRKKTTVERVQKLSEGINQLLGRIYKLDIKDKVMHIDTSYITNNETSIILADKIMTGMQQNIYQKTKKKK